MKNEHINLQRFGILLKNNSISTFIIFALFFMVAAEASAELKISSIYPNVGKIGGELQLTIRGSGFENDTRVSLAIDSGNRRAILGSVATPQSAEAVAVIDTTAYVACFDGGLQLIDVGNPAAPEILNSIDTPGQALAVFVIGDTAYVADGSSGLQVIDVSDLSAPTVVGSIDTRGTASFVTVVGTRAYVADWQNGLQIIDVSHPAAPSIIGSVDTPGQALAVDVAGVTAYVADGSNGLQVIDLTDPTAPDIVGAVDTPGSAGSIVVIDDTAYVADSDTGLQVIDVTDPATPHIIASADTPGYAWTVSIVEGIAYVADHDGGLQLIDVSNPARPYSVGSFDVPGDAKSAVVIDGKAYVSDVSGLQIIDVSNPVKPNLIGSFDASGDSRSIDIVGDAAYLASGFDGGLQIIDISNPTAPRIIGSVDTPGAAQSVTVSVTLAYVADWNRGLQIIDVGNPAAPRIIGSADTPDIARSVAISGTAAYVADDVSGLQIIDVGNPTKPTIIGSIDTPDSARFAAVSGNLVYVADNHSGLQIIDVSDPGTPAIIGSVDTPGPAKSVAIIGAAAFVADGYYGGLQVIDVSDPTAPTIIGSLDTPGAAEAVHVAAGIAYVADWDGGFLAIDVSDPTTPNLVGAVDTPGNAADIVIADGIAYIADADAGLSILPPPMEISPVTLTDAAAIECTLPAPSIPGQYTLRLFDDKGRHHELLGAITFLTPESYERLYRKKAIIVAGSGPSPNNNLWAATQKCSNFAYFTLLSQGYPRENIYFLSPVTGTDLDGDSLDNDIDEEATSDSLSFAVNVWARDAEELLMFMTGHGGDGMFQINGTKNPPDVISVENLDDWLDDLQSVMNGRVIFIYDACRSGSFLSRMLPPQEKDRVLIASAKADEPAWFLQGGVLSFSYQLWSHVYLTAKLYRSFLAGRDMMAGDQTSLLDSDGDGMANEKEDNAAADQVVIGRGRVAASVPPIIYSASVEPRILSGETTATIRVDDIMALNAPARVWAVITPPTGGVESPDQPVTAIPEIELADPDGDGVYTGVYDWFTLQGDYKIAALVEDEQGLYSLPYAINLTQQVEVPVKGDVNGDGVRNLKDLTIALRVLAGMTSFVRQEYAMAGIDVNGDGRVGLAEAEFLMQKMAE